MRKPWPPLRDLDHLGRTRNAAIHGLAPLTDDALCIPHDNISIRHGSPACVYVGLLLVTNCRRFSQSCPSPPRCRHYSPPGPSPIRAAVCGCRLKSLTAGASLGKKQRLLLGESNEICSPGDSVEKS